jgi:hypothetical protein
MLTSLAKLAAAGDKLAEEAAEARTNNKRTCLTRLTDAKQRGAELEKALSPTTFGQGCQSQRRANKVIHEAVSAHAMKMTHGESETLKYFNGPLSRVQKVTLVRLVMTHWSKMEEGCR